MSEFQDKVVLITGAGKGIGRALAMAFARQGAIIAANDISPVNLDSTIDLVERDGGRIKEYIFDVAKRMPIEAMIDIVLEDWGRIDILINNASVEPRAPILDMDEWDWQRALDVNLSGPFFTMQHAGRAMRTQGSGVIVNIGSTAGMAHGLKNRAAFIASKTGLIGLSREAAREFAAFGVRVNVVSPGWITAGEAAEEVSQKESQPALDRPGSPEEVVSLVLFLCSQQASYITGQAIHVDGGEVMC